MDEKAMTFPVELFFALVSSAMILYVVGELGV